jgi:hypothetical protein
MTSNSPQQGLQATTATVLLGQVAVEALSIIPVIETIFFGSDPMID